MTRLVLGLAIAALTLSGASADPLTEAFAGKLQCYRPNTAKKNCGELSTYT